MRISDWSSDVCSYGLRGFLGKHQELLGGVAGQEEGLPGLPGRARRLLAVHILVDLREARQVRQRRIAADLAVGVERAEGEQRHHGALFDQRHDVLQVRSEEHTSELQSLMRTSYAVFCLKKKKRK